MLTPRSYGEVLTDEPWSQSSCWENVSHSPAWLLLPTHTFSTLLIITREAMKANVHQSPV